MEVDRFASNLSTRLSSAYRQQLEESNATLRDRSLCVNFESVYYEKQ